VAGPGATLARDAGALAVVGGFSAGVNLLVLTGPIFALEVYDRVLTTGSGETLVMLLLLAVLMHGALSLVDMSRATLLGRIALRWRARMRASAPDAAQDIADLDCVQRCLAGPAATAVFDLPFVPLFLTVLFLLHPAVGGLAMGAIVLVLAWVAVALLATRGPQRRAEASARAARAALHPGGGMSAPNSPRDGWAADDAAAGMAGLAAAERGAALGALGRFLKLVLQSGMLALGAWLVIGGALTPGAMVAATILLARALAPVEQIAAAGLGLPPARAAWLRIEGRRRASSAPALRAAAAPAAGLALPARPGVAASDLSVWCPGAPAAAPDSAGDDDGRDSATPRVVLGDLCFTIAPGQALGVLGASGAGKTALAETLVGLRPPAAGRLTLGGLPVTRIDPADRARATHYLPQEPAPFAATVAACIADGADDADPAEIIAAAERAGAHRMILSLPDGYATRLGPPGPGLSPGQRQRIALARAVFTAPRLCIFDAPEAHLDGAGLRALDAVIADLKAKGAVVVVCSQRPSAVLGCDLVLLLDGGRQQAFGPRAAVLRGALGAAAAGVPGDPAGPAFASVRGGAR
jgi:ATP-binding cassette subfamily C protein